MSPLPTQFSRVAIFIDAENLIIESDKAGLAFALRPIADRIREEGQIIFARAYADWMKPQIGRYLREFRQNVIEMTQLPTDAAGKNTADINLAVDALEMALLPSAPDIVVLAAGDRDFVPLVQKIKRYGKAVIGIGVKGSSSRDLTLACDVFLFIDDILQDGLSRDSQLDATDDTVLASSEQTIPSLVSPMAPPVSPEKVADVIPVQPTPLPHVIAATYQPAAAGLTPEERGRAFTLLSRAVATLARQAQPALGSNTCLLMQRLDSTFDPIRFGFASFKDFSLAAQREGYVRLNLFDGGNITFDTDFQPGFKVGEHVEDNESELSFATTMQARNSYLAILGKKKHVKVIPWDQRRLLVTRLWSLLVESGEEGRSLDELLYELKNFSMRRHLNIPDRDIEVLVRTLNIAHCFAAAGIVAYQYDFSDTKVTAAVDLDEALLLMNYTYVKGITLELPDVPLLEEGIASFLFDSVNDDTRADARKIIDRVSGKPADVMTVFEDAFQRAAKKG